MRLSIVVSVAGLVGLVLGWAGEVGAQRVQDQIAVQADSKLEEGVEIQTRGPVHEAFAQPVSRDPEPAPLVRKKPPEPIPELPPDLKPEGEASVWIPGYWAWDEDRDDYLWVSGTWRVPPPGRTWVPGYWDDEQGGWRWVAGYWAVQGEAQVELYPEPPAPIQEAIPAQEEEGTTYIAGNWVYRSDRYWWRPGYYVRYRPGWVWVNPCYYWTPAGYVFTDGYWDLDFQRRGLLFAPIYFHQPYWQRAGWYYRPHYAVHTDFLFGSLFVNVGRRHYFFGDYYEARYGGLGYYPWANYRFGGGRYYDPMFAYYRWHFRDRDRWEERMRETYIARRDGRAAPPPRTFAEQQKQEARQGNDMRVVVPLQQFTKVQTNVKLAPVTKVQLQQAQKTAQEINTARQVRAKGEAKVRADGRVAAKQPVKIDAPRVELSARAKAGQDTPPPPPVPKAVEKKPVAGERKVRDVEPPKGRDIEPAPKKGRDVDPPKGKEVPKGKDAPPKPKEAAPKPKEAPPKPKEAAPKPKELAPAPKVREVEPPKAREVAPPKGKDAPPPKARDAEPAAKPSTRPSVIPEVREPAPRAAPKTPVTRPRDVDGAPREAPPPADASPDRPERRPAPRPVEKDRKRDRDPDR
jgi:hypothetical protein